jgi:hypothetical protein
LPNEFTAHAELRVSLVHRTPELVKTILTPATLEIHLSDGQIITYPRNPIDIGTLAFSLREADDGRFVYEYTLDNRQVEMIRVGDFNHQFGRPDMSCPEGWYGSSCSWHPRWDKTPARIEVAKYSIVSNYLPGALCLHIAGKDEVREGFELPFKGANASERSLMQQIWLQIRSYGNSVDPLVIGPVFEPEAPEQQVRDRIRRWIQEYNLDFLRPLNDPNIKLPEAIGSVVAGFRFEAQILNCVRTAISVMVPYDPEAEPRERARLKREAQRTWGTRGVNSLEQARARLRSFRLCQDILRIIQIRVSLLAMRHSNLPHQLRHRSEPDPVWEEQQNTRLSVLTKSQAFIRRWPSLAKRLSEDEQYCERLAKGGRAAEERIRNNIEGVLTAFPDLKVSPESAIREIVKTCAANLDKIQARSVVGIHLNGEEARASISAENWQFINEQMPGPTHWRTFTCQIGKHQLRASVWSDEVDENIGRIDFQLCVQVPLRNPDGSLGTIVLEENRLLIFENGSEVLFDESGVRR